MTKWYYVLILLFISTGYLFSQTEENKIVQIDTVVSVDTIQIEKADTTMVEESIVDTVIVGEPISDPEEKKEFIKQDFYNDYLISLPDTINYLIKKKPVDTTDYKNKKMGLFSARMSGFGFVSTSFVLDIPTNDNMLNISSYLCFTAGNGDMVLGLGIAYLPIKNKNFILKWDLRPSIIPGGGGTIFGLNVGIDCIIFKFISISQDCLIFVGNHRGHIVPPLMLSFGINLYKVTSKN